MRINEIKEGQRFFFDFDNVISNGEGLEKVPLMIEGGVACFSDTGGTVWEYGSNEYTVLSRTGGQRHFCFPADGETPVRLA